MDEILDKNYVNNLKPLEISSKGSGFLSVDQEAWKDELYRLERKDSMGCVFVFILSLCLLIVIVSFSFWYWVLTLGTGLYLGIQYKIFNSKRYNNLKKHGQYNYEIYDKKLVRYSDTKYLIFEYKDIQSIKYTSFGLVVFKQKRLSSYFLRDTDSDLIVIPNKVQIYNGIVKHLLGVFHGQETATSPPKASKENSPDA